MLKSDEAEVRKTDLSYRNDEQVVPLLVSHRRSASAIVFFQHCVIKRIDGKLLQKFKAGLQKRDLDKRMRKKYTKNAMSHEKG
jgi:hypothetical protein